MQWQRAKRKSIISFLLAIELSVVSVNVSSNDEINEDRLWLPTKYTRLFMDLKDAALAAKKLDRCKTVLRGTIDLEQSSDDRPMYRILCRQANGRSYNEMIDGVTFMPSQDGVEERKQHLWSLCESGIANKIKLMQDVSWVSKLPVEPDLFEEKKAMYTVDFDAKDGFGQPLHYRARCNFGAKDALSIRISGRKPQ